MNVLLFDIWDEMASKEGIKREQQDEYSIFSFERVTQALKDGMFDNKVAQIKIKYGQDLKQDEQKIKTHLVAIQQYAKNGTTKLPPFVLIRYSPLLQKFVLVSTNTKDSSMSISSEAAQSKADITAFIFAIDAKVKTKQKYQLIESELILQTFKISEVCHKNELQNNTSSDFTLKDTDTLKSISPKKLIVKCRLETYDRKQSVCSQVDESAQQSESQQLSEQQ
ncbi:MAG: hypothetical protein EZS28_032792 [Streblomastix strix]|uniref:Uncharacterized protein n=1 Tax=Streblomastix strix TaxID=222440 RepID=A0A5J4UNP0_9EUKA|nr:MAG: hypothetical protein EZS28_032792 [Streblomastix strix]